MGSSGNEIEKEATCPDGRFCAGAAVRSDFTGCCLGRHAASCQCGAMVFTESRENPIRPALGIQEAWKAQAGQLHPTFEGRARPGDVFTFQVGVQVLVNVGPLGISFGDLTGNDGAITAGAIRCLSLNGTNCDGSVLAKSISVAAGKLQALWVGMDVPMIARHLFGHGAIAVEQLDLAAGFHSIDGRRRGVDGSR